MTVYDNPPEYLSNTKKLDVEIDKDNIPKTEVDKIIGKKVKDKEKKN